MVGDHCREREHMDKHREKCKNLKDIRKKMADRLGIDLHQRECTYQGKCSGTCPKCRQEEEILNKALLGKTAAAVAITAGVMLTGCGPIEETGTPSAPPVASHHGENVTWEKAMDSVAGFFKGLAPGYGNGELSGDVEYNPDLIEGGLILPDDKIQVLPDNDIAGMEQDIRDIYGEDDEDVPEESGE